VNRFSAGLITGGIIGAIGLSYALSDKRARRKISRGSKRVMDKANGLIGNIADKF
jgi:hypothetical protein